MSVTPFEAYKKYLAIKLHFSSKSYDYFKFKGVVSAKKESFDKRTDRYFFAKIAKRFSAEDYEKFLFANFLQESLWIGDLIEDRGRENYLNWLKRVESLKYTFKQDIGTMREIGQSEYGTLAADDPGFFNSLFTSKGAYPAILGMTMHGRIGLETFIILNILLDFIPRFDTIIDDELIWPEFRTKAIKYQPFLARRVDKVEFKRVLKECLGVSNK